MKKRISPSQALALILCLCMVLSALAPLAIFAEPSSETPTFNTSTPIHLYDFTTDDIMACMSNIAKINLSYSPDGYTTITATEDDPNLYLTAPTVKANQLKYAVLTYRTTAQRSAEFYATRSDGVNMGEAGSHVPFALTTDGEWHTAVVYCEAWANASDDVVLTALRYDPLQLKVQNGESIDVKFVAFFSTQEDAEAFDLDTYKAKIQYEEDNAPKPDPSTPVHIYDFKTIAVEAQMGGMNNMTYEFKDGYITFTATGDDPNVMLTPPPVKLADLQYALILQRTTSKRQGEFYVDRSDGKKMGEAGTNVKYSLDSSGEWKAVVAPCTAWADVSQDVAIQTFRYDPIQLNVTAGETIDVQYVAFFKTEAEAKAFDYEAYLEMLEAEKEQQKQEEQQKAEVDWPDTDHKDKLVTSLDNYQGTLTYTPSEDGKTLTISYKVNGETVTYTVPNTNQYKSGPLVATDDLGRSLYSASDVGVIGDNGQHYVGLFYFLWHGEHGENGVNDINNILAGNGTFGKVNEWHWWGQPLYGYYYAKDAWVMRKHAELLCNIGVDFLFFDCTNNSSYAYNALQLMEILHQLNEEGYDAPKVVFYTNTDATKRVKEIYDRIYAQNMYPDTWFYLDGKPVIIAPYEANINDFFTIKLNQWPNVEEHKDNAWPWMDFGWPQRIYNDESGNPSAISVSVAQHSGTVRFSDSGLYGDYTNRGRSFAAKELRDRYLKDAYNAAQKDPTLSYQGLNFQAQFDYAIENDVEFVLVTGWNEWVATRQDPVAYGYPDQLDRIIFVDNFNTEYSRDIEMMSGGYFDNYYIQLAYNIQKLKGTAPTIVQDARKSINVTDHFDQWESVVVEYADPTGDTIHRDAMGFGQVKYTNTTGRNDIVSAKVTGDSRYIYVYAKTVYDISMFDTDSSWMQLFLNADGDASTGWYGYDFIVNYSATSTSKTTIAKYNGTNGEYSFEVVGETSYKVKDNEMMIEIPLSVLGYERYDAVYFEFKWVDSASKITTMEQFYTDGDCAPLGRMNYVYQNYIPGVSVLGELETLPGETTEGTPDGTPDGTTDTTTEANNGGCASVVVVGLMPLMGVVALGAVCLKKKD